MVPKWISDALEESRKRLQNLWVPNPGPQTAFMKCDAFECLYGGQVGGGKTDAVIHDALRDIARPEYNAIILRRTFRELEQNIISRSWKYYPAFGAKYNESKKTWTFPSGAKVVFGYMDSENDVYQYLGTEWCYVGFDELTQFSRSQYVFMIGRMRSPVGLPLRIRGTTNPGGAGHRWVYERWGPWLNPAFPHRAQPGEVLRYRLTDAGEEWSDDGDQSRVFIPAALSDTPQLSGQNYESRLMNLDPVERERMMKGNWLIQPDGLAFPMFDPAFHIREPENNFWSEIIVGVDHGFDDAGVFLIVGVRGNGRDAECHIIEEVYKSHEVQSYWLDKALDVNGRYSKYGSRWWADKSRPENIKSFRDYAGLNIAASDSGHGSIVAGVDLISDKLAVRTRHDGSKYCKLYVSPNCKNTIRELSEYRRKRDKNGVVHDEFDDKHNHAIDSLRYCLVGRFGRPESKRIEYGPGV